MADVAEVVNEVQSVEKEAKKVVDVEDDSVEEKAEEKTKENSAENGHKVEGETNGDATEVTATKRKSGAGDNPDGVPAEGATPEKKAKISTEEKETKSESTNGESEVAA